MNAQLRSLMASHDAMSAMERLAAHQQWQKSLLNLNSLQQQNPLIYGHAFPAAAAAAAALFTGIGGIGQLIFANIYGPVVLFSDFALGNIKSSNPCPNEENLKMNM